MILGSGLSAVEECIESDPSVPYTGIPGLRRPSVAGHAGRFTLARAEGKGVLLCAGRHHLYEGFDCEGAGSVVAAAAAMGCASILLTQAVGGLHRNIPSGSWLVPTDIVFLPVRGRGMDRPDGLKRSGEIRAAGGSLIETRLRDAVVSAVRHAGLTPRDALLYWTPGPSYETAAEARAGVALGADAANMSCLPELLAARRAGVAAACLSWVTNHTANCSTRRTDHDEIVRRGALAARSLARIVVALARRVG